MAVVKSFIQDAFTSGFDKRNAIRGVQHSMGLKLVERADGTIILAKKQTKREKGRKLWYSREFFCYCDLLWRRMTRAQMQKWQEYYQKENKKFHKSYYTFKRTSKSRFRRKYWNWNSFALWVYCLSKYKMDEFFEKYLNATFILTKFEFSPEKIEAKLWIRHKDYVKWLEEHLEDIANYIPCKR